MSANLHNNIWSEITLAGISLGIPERRIRKACQWHSSGNVFDVAYTSPAAAIQRELVTRPKLIIVWQPFNGAEVISKCPLQSEPVGRSWETNPRPTCSPKHRRIFSQHDRVWLVGLADGVGHRTGAQLCASVCSASGPSRVQHTGLGSLVRLSCKTEAWCQWRV